MLTLISPAKTLDFESPCKDAAITRPAFPSKSRELISILKTKNTAEIKKLMDLSDSLAELNVKRYKKWTSPAKLSPTGRQAGYAFKGDVYIGLDFPSLKNGDMEYAQNNLRILSGLYGILKPLDIIAPHRLEMGTRLVNNVGKSLYAFWGETQTKFLNKELRKSDSQTVVNLASDEYFKSVKQAKLKGNVITPKFLDSNDGKTFRVMSFYAKRTRGSMARWLIENRIEDEDAITSFSEDGYKYDADSSTEDIPVFKRSHAA